MCWARAPAHLRGGPGAPLGAHLAPRAISRELQIAPPIYAPRMEWDNIDGARLLGEGRERGECASSFSL